METLVQELVARNFSFKFIPDEQNIVEIEGYTIIQDKEENAFYYLADDSDELIDFELDDLNWMCR